MFSVPPALRVMAPRFTVSTVATLAVTCDAPEFRVVVVKTCELFVVIRVSVKVPPLRISEVLPAIEPLVPPAPILSVLPGLMVVAPV